MSGQTLPITNLDASVTDWRCLLTNTNSSEFLSAGIDGPRLRFTREVPANASTQPVRREVVLAVPMNTGTVEAPNYQTMSLRAKISTPAGVSEADALAQIDSFIAVLQDDNVKAPFLTSVFLPDANETTA